MCENIYFIKLIYNMKTFAFINKTFSQNNVHSVQQTFKENKISDLKYKNSYDDYFQLYIQKGGDQIGEIKISPNKYKFRVDEYNASTEKIFALIKLDAEYNNIKGDFEEDDYCGYMIIDETNKSATIQSLSNYKKCIECIEKKVNYKIGDILMQIMIIIAKKKGIETITITDNSQITCNNYKLQLIYFRVLTQGKPLYTKYGFIPVNKKDFDRCNDNHTLFYTHPTISKTRILKMILKYCDKQNIDTFNAYINKLYDNKDKLLISTLFNKIMEDSKNNISLCELIYNIYMQVYDYANYKRLYDNSFILNLNKINIHNNPLQKR